MDIVYTPTSTFGENDTLAVFLCDGKKLTFQGIYENLGEYYKSCTDKNVKKNWNITLKLDLCRWIKMKAGRVA